MKCTVAAPLAKTAVFEESFIISLVKWLTKNEYFFSTIMLGHLTHSTN